METPLSLLQRVRHLDDQSAWARFASLYQPMLHTWARRAGMNDADSAEITQEIMAHLVEALPQYDRSRGGFRGWLKTITINKCREWQRNRAVERRAQGCPDLEVLASSDPATGFWETEYQECLLRRALSVMQSEFQFKTWQACWQHIVSGQSAQEIGKSLGMSEAAVYMAKARVLKRVREELDEFWE